MKNSDAVSENQLFYVVTIELFCLISLFLPGFLSGDLKQDSIIGLIVGFGFACIFAWLLSMFCARYGNVFLKADKKSGVIMDIFRFILFIQTILITVFVLNITWEIVQMFLLPDVNKTVILVGNKISAGYTAYGTSFGNFRTFEYVPAVQTYPFGAFIAAE